MRSLQSSMLFLLSSILFLLCLSTTCGKTLADSPSSSEEAKIYIVFTERPQEGVDPKSTYVKILASVLGSEKAAKGVLIYVYKYVVCGFSAKLTPHQVIELSKKPGVLQILPNHIYELQPRLGNSGGPSL